MLPDDISARQKLLESSVYDLAVERMQHDRDNLEERGINSAKLQHAQLQEKCSVAAFNINIRLLDFTDDNKTRN